MLATDIASHSNAGSGTKEPVLDPGCGKPTIVTGNGEIAGSDELTASRSRNPMRSRDHRHRHRLNGAHKAVANGKDVPPLIKRPILHLFQVVPSRKSPPGALQNDGPHLRPRPLPLEPGGQPLPQPRRRRS